MNVSSSSSNPTASMVAGSIFKSHFGIVDYVILGVVLFTSLLLGLLAGKKGSGNTRDFLTGDRNMNPVAVCLSLLGGCISAISVQGNATEVYMHGTQIWMNLLGCSWGTLIVMFLILPVLYPLNLVSMCQYLEMRYDSPFLKKLGSMTQIFNNIMFLGICLYAPALTLSSAIGIPTSLAIVIFSCICGVYITAGGLRAVVYTDVLQTLMMFMGVLAVVVQVLIDLGGFSKVWSIAEQGGRLQFFNFDTNPLERHTFWSVQVLGLNFVVSVIGISQTQFQRLSSVRSLSISRRLCVSFLIGVSVLWSLFYFSGLVAYAAYADCDPASSGKVEKADQILPYLVGDKLSHVTGMVGLFVSAVAGALLSSLSSYVNSTVVLLWEDFFSGWWIFKGASHGKATTYTKILCSSMVFLAVGVALSVANMGTLFQVAYSISGTFIGPFDGMFITGIAAPWVNGKGATAGFMAALALNLWLMTGKLVYGAGKSVPLHTSTLGCHSDSIHATSHNITLPENIFYLEDTDAGVEFLKRDYPAVYDISYCYLGSIGVIVVLVVSSIVSFFTGVIKPSEVNQKLVSGRCYKIYSRLYSLCHSETDSLDVTSLAHSPNQGEKKEDIGEWQTTKAEA